MRWSIVKNIIGIVFCFGYALSAWRTDVIPYHNRQRLELHKLHLRLDGIVTKIVDIKNGNFGVISLRVTDTNVPNLSENDSVHHYWYLIKDKKAKIITNIGGIQVGDSLHINTDRSLIKIYRQTWLVEKQEIIYVVSDDFYEKVRPLMNL